MTDSGFISHANNMPIGTWYPFDLGLGTGGNGHTGRSWRLQQLLTGAQKYDVADFESLVHRDPVNPVLTALLPIAIKVVDEEHVADAAVTQLIDAVRGWDRRAETQASFPALARLRNVLTPCQGMTPLQLPRIDPSLDIVSPPLTCLDTDTIWSQPGNVYTHIVDLADTDNSRAMIAPGNCEDGANPLRTAGMDLWVQGRTRPAPLSRVNVEQLGGTRTAIAARAYLGPTSSPALIVDQADPAWEFVAAIPAATPEQKVEPRPRPAEAQKPGDPQLEAALRVILRPSGTPDEEVDAQLDDVRKYVEGKPELVKQLRGGALLGVYLVEESTAGRLKVRYGSPYVLARLRELLQELAAGTPPAPAPASEPDPALPPATTGEPGPLGH